jgi:hypothetical protein
MTQRRRFKQTASLQDRLAAFAADMEEKATNAQPGLERDKLIKRARQTEVASRLDEWASSPGLQPPK